MIHTRSNLAPSVCMMHKLNKMPVIMSIITSFQGQLQLQTFSLISNLAVYLQVLYGLPRKISSYTNDLPKHNWIMYKIIIEGNGIATVIVFANEIKRPFTKRMTCLFPKISLYMHPLFLEKICKVQCFYGRYCYNVPVDASLINITRLEAP